MLNCSSWCISNLLNTEQSRRYSKASIVHSNFQNDAFHSAAPLIYIIKTWKGKVVYHFVFLPHTFQKGPDLHSSYCQLPRMPTWKGRKLKLSKLYYRARAYSSVGCWTFDDDENVDCLLFCIYVFAHWRRLFLRSIMLIITQWSSLLTFKPDAPIKCYLIHIFAELSCENAHPHKLWSHQPRLFQRRNRRKNPTSLNWWC